MPKKKKGKVRRIADLNLPRHPKTANEITHNCVVALLSLTPSIVGERDAMALLRIVRRLEGMAERYEYLSK